MHLTQVLEEGPRLPRAPGHPGPHPKLQHPTAVCFLFDTAFFFQILIPKDNLI
jgi:hypothetical protein